MLKVSSLLQFAITSPKALFFLLKNYLTEPKQINLLTFSDSEVAFALKQGKSLIRMGDGEAMLLTGRSIHFQKYSKGLRKELLTCIRSYDNNSPYLLAVPHFALAESTEILRSRGRLRIWRLFKVIFPIYFDAKSRYADAVTFYHAQSFSTLITSLLEPSQVIVLTKEENMTQLLKSTLAQSTKNITYITTPPKNTYTEIDKIESDILSIAKNSKLPLLLLAAAGPAAKVLCYRLSQKNVQCVDMGHGIEILGQTYDYADRL